MPKSQKPLSLCPQGLLGPAALSSSPVSSDYQAPGRTPALPISCHPRHVTAHPCLVPGARPWAWASCLLFLTPWPPCCGGPSAWSRTPPCARTWNPDPAAASAPAHWGPSQRPRQSDPLCRQEGQQGRQGAAVPGAPAQQLELACSVSREGPRLPFEVPSRALSCAR